MVLLVYTHLAELLLESNPRWELMAWKSRIQRVLEERFANSVLLVTNVWSRIP